MELVPVEAEGCVALRGRGQQVFQPREPWLSCSSGRGELGAFPAGMDYSSAGGLSPG